MSRLRQITLLAVVLAAVAVPAVMPARAAALAPLAGGQGAPWLQPADGIFTCSWIDAHPAAAIHWRVSCDAAGPPEPNDTTTASSSQSGVMPLATGCQWIPDEYHYVSIGVYAWTAYEYANEWSWNAYTNPPGGILWYHWYLQKTDGTNYANDATTSSSGSIYPPANTYRWGAQNTNGNPTQWWVCYQG